MCDYEDKYENADGRRRGEKDMDQFMIQKMLKEGLIWIDETEFTIIGKAIPHTIVSDN